ncbi:hypothetical protein EVAR_6314_1 [Eumeta japonica]|uniref:Uncharacterized protein n=1 Tax=Eumeta variegata TaxID=151549 RepID=A0A4C1TBS6_EUMVA|nr:hypothetical protein EVAR_6314_1 [Eumeta japonica]
MKVPVEERDLLPDSAAKMQLGHLFVTSASPVQSVECDPDISFRTDSSVALGSITYMCQWCGALKDEAPAAKPREYVRGRQGALGGDSVVSVRASFKRRHLNDMSRRSRDPDVINTLNTISGSEESGNFDVKDEPRFDRPVTDRVDVILEKVEKDRHSSCYNIGEKLGIDHNSFETFEKMLDIQKARYLGPIRTH